MKLAKQLVIVLGSILTVSLLIAAATNPQRIGLMYSTDGTGNPGTWVGMTGSGGALYTGSVTPSGMFYSTDGTGNPGTWAAMTATSFGSGTVSGQANKVVPLGTTANSITQQSHIDENTAGATTLSQAAVVNNSVVSAYSASFNNTAAGGGVINSFSNLCSGMLAGGDCWTNLTGKTSASANNVVRTQFHFTGAGSALNYFLMDFFGNTFIKCMASGSCMFNQPLTLSSQAAIASAATIAPTTQAFHVTGSVSIGTITAPTACTGTTTMCQITIIPDAVLTTLTSGNIAIASTTVISKALIMTYDPATSKWYPSY
jgi:hypothetical protein